MTRIAIVFIFSMVLLAPGLVHGQEPGTVSGNDERVQKSLVIAREMAGMIRALPDSFKQYKGDFAMKDEAGDSFYKTNDTDLGTDQQFVEVKPSGVVLFVATWKKKDKNDKTPVFAFAAFSGGILNVTDGQGYMVSNPITDSTTSEMKYYLKAPGADGAMLSSFKFNPIFKESTFIVGEHVDRE